MRVEAGKFTELLENEIQVLHGVSLRARRGETLSIMGASGTGKSTLLHILGMLDVPDEGTLQIDQVSVLQESSAARTRRRAKMIGFVFQQWMMHCRGNQVSARSCLNSTAANPKRLRTTFGGTFI